MGGPAWLGLRHWQTGFQHLGCSCCKLSFGPFLFLGLALLRGLRRGGFCTVDVVVVCFPGGSAGGGLLHSGRGCGLLPGGSAGKGFGGMRSVRLADGTAALRFAGRRAAVCSAPSSHLRLGLCVTVVARPGPRDQDEMQPWYFFPEEPAGSQARGRQARRRRNP